GLRHARQRGRRINVCHLDHRLGLSWRAVAGLDARRARRVGFYRDTHEVQGQGLLLKEKANRLLVQLWRYKGPLLLTEKQNWSRKRKRSRSARWRGSAIARAPGGAYAVRISALRRSASRARGWIWLEGLFS